MATLRLGVALLLPSPLDREVDTLRRATGDGTYGRVPSHLTLVPPVNVGEDRLDDALRRLREAAAATRPFTVELGPPTTFLPDNPVLYLPVVSGAVNIVAVRDRVFRDPLARPLTWPFVAHVTLADEAPAGRILAAREALADFRAEATFERVHLLAEGPGRAWAPIADASFAAPAVIGRGGLPLELSVTDDADPGVRAFLRSSRRDVTITARRDGRVVGMARGWAAGEVAELVELVVADVEASLGTDTHLRAAFGSWAAEHGDL